MSIFAQNLRRLRQEKGLTQKQLAKLANISHQSISYYENGERPVNSDSLIAIAKCLGVSTDYLLGISKVSSLDTDLQAICQYTGLSESVVEYAHSTFEKMKIGQKELDKITKMISTEVKKSNGQSTELLSELFHSEMSFNDDVDYYSYFTQFLDDLISFSQIHKIVRAYAIACEEQSKDLKLIRYSEFLKNGSCKYEEELSEFVSAKENGLLVYDSENDNLNSALFTLSRLVLKMVETKAEKDSVTEEYLQNELAKADNLLKKEFEDSFRQTLSKPFKSIIDKAVDDAYEAYMNSTGKSSGQQEGENNAQHKSENE